MNDLEGQGDIKNTQFGPSADNNDNFSPEDFDEIKCATVDVNGTFPYVLLSLKERPEYIQGTPDEKTMIDVVRGTKKCMNHVEVINKFLVEELDSIQDNQDLDTKPMGGGYIEANKAEHKMLLFGAAKGLGKADHERVC